MCDYQTISVLTDDTLAEVSFYRGENINQTVREIIILLKKNKKEQEGSINESVGTCSDYIVKYTFQQNT